MSLELVAPSLSAPVTGTATTIPVPLPPMLTNWSHEVAVTNTGNATAYVAIGGTAAIPTADQPAAGYPVQPGATVVLHAPTAGITTVSAIATATTTVMVTAVEEAV